MTAIRDVLKREIKALAFDQYGTIVDIQKGLTEASTPFLKAKGWSGNPNSFVTWWRRTHYENSMIDALCDRGHTPYRQIGHRAVSHVMDRCGFAYTQDEVKMLVGEIEKLKPFPDVVASLGRLRSAGYQLAGQLGALSAAQRAPAIYRMLHDTYQAQPAFDEPTAGAFYELRRKP